MNTGKKKRQAPKFGRALGQVLARDARLTREWPKKAPEIVARYNLQGLEAQLTDAMIMALERYDAWHVENRRLAAGLGTNEQLDQLESALRRCTNLLTNEALLNRLELAAIEMPPDPKAPFAEAEYIFGAGVFDAVAHAGRQVAGLLAMVKYARRIDGRGHNVLPRDDLRAAAEQFRDFWVKDARRSGRHWHRGSYSPAVRFIHSCLECIDSTAKLSLIAKPRLKP